MAPLISKKQLHKDHHDVWSDIAGESMELMMRLMATPGNTGTKMRSEILLNSEEEIASTLESILECLECEVRLKRLAIETLLNLSLDTSSVTAGGSSARRFTWILLVVLILRQDQCPSTHVLRKNSDIRRLAREKLLAMLSLIEEPSAMLPLQQNDDEGNSTHMLQAVRFVLGDLTRAFLDAGNISDRVRAVKILWYLVEYYTKDDGYLKELKKAVAIVMPEVLKLLLGYISPLEDIDIESGGIPQENTSPSQHRQKGELWKALVYLCSVLLWNRYWKNDSDLARQIDENLEKLCSEQGKKRVYKFHELVIEADEFLEKKKAEERTRVQTSRSSAT
ncbi:hypothetical protein QOZ80_5BG0441490 [Eleusine coracana subsp. coracana]|nr:hypothetical protein QOZ80_5BG0441490 [Eleusine coracana subsp. coracana]